MGTGRRAALAVLCVASFLAVVDTTIVTIALPSIRRTLGFSADQAQWVLNAYALVFGGLLLLFGRLADRVGRRRMFGLGLVVFGVGSVLAGLAPQGWVLIAGRFVQGVGGAAFVPSSLSLLTAAFPEQAERSRALAAYGAMAGLGFVAGMVGGGVITQLWGWRWIFLINAPIVAATLAAASRALERSRGARPQYPIDIAGAISVTVGLILINDALATMTWLPGVLGVAALTVFVLVERRHPDPLLPAGVVANRAIAAPNVAIALQSMVGVGWLYLLTLYLQEVRDYDPLLSGLLFAPMTLASLVGASVAGRAATRFGPRVASTAGMVLLFVGLAAMAGAMAVPDGLALLIAGMVVGEAGFMLASVALTIVATGNLADRHAGLAAGLLNTATQLGGGVGLALVATVIAAVNSRPVVEPGALAAGFLTCLGFVVISLLVTITSVRLVSTEVTRCGRDGRPRRCAIRGAGRAAAPGTASR